ncbi:molybdopterin converting factor small subunit [Pseudonocardia sediminis]|uniref:Molybdopterin converting factor small subunit n=1 Tax=Pseudonocardia sediminis TaxID=1397368 RepID=A0A4Q7V720_PSEST|nr:MoaD/ThiS family protein [Pseudonocardia sediminis]RZT88593.1 molybdopterin converting factor small subunit [Pseudonocardia sediminis]
MSAPTLTTIEVRYFAAAKAAAGLPQEKVEIPADATVADVLDAVRALHGAELARVLERCSFLLDEVAVRDRDLRVGGATALDVLPPFAGG